MAFGVSVNPLCFLTNLSEVCYKHRPCVMFWGDAEERTRIPHLGCHILAQGQQVANLRWSRNGTQRKQKVEARDDPETTEPRELVGSLGNALEWTHTPPPQSLGSPWYTACLRHSIIPQTLSGTMSFWSSPCTTDRLGSLAKITCVRTAAPLWVVRLEVKCMTALLLAVAESIFELWAVSNGAVTWHLRLGTASSPLFWEAGLQEGAAKLVSGPGHLSSNHSWAHFHCSILWHMLEGLQSWKILRSIYGKGQRAKLSSCNMFSGGEIKGCLKKKKKKKWFQFLMLYLGLSWLKAWMEHKSGLGKCGKIYFHNLFSI